MCAKLLQSCLTVWTIACQFPLSIEFSRQEYWSQLTFPTLGGPFWLEDWLTHVSYAAVYLLSLEPHLHSTLPLALRASTIMPLPSPPNYGRLFLVSGFVFTSSCISCIGRQILYLLSHLGSFTWNCFSADYHQPRYGLCSLQPKMEKLYTISKNKTRSWLWLRSWTPYCEIQT